MSQSEKEAPEAQSFVASGTSEAAISVRDQFSVSKALPANAQPYSRIADTFSNNPNSLVNWPLALGAPISSPYGWRTLRGAPNFHTGLDINPGLGTPIQAIAEGTVIDVGNLQGDAGTYVRVEHQIEGETVVSLYAHMLEDSPAVAVGDRVARSQVIGNVGCTGNCTGPHVHLELTVNGDLIDPYPWMKRKVGS
jgi:murein DD-endopeptidase MepM/ murein hydrolase activator NlpD